MFTKLQGQRYFFSTTKIINILLLLFSCCASIIFLEVILHLFRPPALVGIGTTRTPNAVFYGWAMPPNEHFQFIHPDTGEHFTFKINSQGWKDVEHVARKPEGTYRILFIGDSNTFGVVPFGNEYPRQVEHLLHQQGWTNVEILSIGLSGWGTDHALEALIHDGLRYAPDIVVYQFCGNDVFENLPPVIPDALQAKKPFQYILEHGKLTRTVRTIPELQAMRDYPFRAWMRQAVHQSAILWTWKEIKKLRAGKANEQVLHEALRSQHWWEQYAPDPTSPYYLFSEDRESAEMQYAWQLLEALIVEIKRVVIEEGHAKFIIFSEEGDAGKREWMLRWKQFETDEEGDYILRDGMRFPVKWKHPLDKLSVICREQRIPLIMPNRSYTRYIYDPHANSEGNMNMAQDIVDFLFANELL